jgi:hypothetical protein
MGRPASPVRGSVASARARRRRASGVLIRSRVRRNSAVFRAPSSAGDQATAPAGTLGAAGSEPSATLPLTSLSASASVVAAVDGSVVADSAMVASGPAAATVSGSPPQPVVQPAARLEASAALIASVRVRSTAAAASTCRCSTRRERFSVSSAKSAASRNPAPASSSTTAAVPASSSARDAFISAVAGRDAGTSAVKPAAAAPPSDVPFIGLPVREPAEGTLRSARPPSRAAALRPETSVPAAMSARSSPKASIGKLSQPGLTFLDVTGDTANRGSGGSTAVGRRCVRNGGAGSGRSRSPGSGDATKQGSTQAGQCCPA